jgi:hypothetical protein
VIQGEYRECEKNINSCGLVLCGLVGELSVSGFDFFLMWYCVVFFFVLLVFGFSLWVF